MQMHEDLSSAMHANDDLSAEIARLRAENARMRKALNVIAGSAARATLKETT